MKTLEEMPRHRPALVEHVGGSRSFRRRLLEMGLVPGTTVHVRNVAPFGDPIEIEVRHSRLSIRRHEAKMVRVKP